MKKILIANLAITLLLVAVLDAAAFELLPERYAASFPGYRREFRVVDPLMVSWPRWYYVADSKRGFELGKNVKSHQVVDGNTFPIWTNSEGCFDREHVGDSAYVYFAGDSFTWGHVPYADNFGTIIETATGIPIYKCGMEHTGQRHQLGKLLDITANTATLPNAVFVFHFDNDIANDYAFPHSTVVDGWLADEVVTDLDHTLVHRSRKDILNGIQTSVRLAAIQRHNDSVAFNNPVYRLRRTISEYSITENVVRTMVKRIAHHLQVPSQLTAQDHASGSRPGELERRPKSQKLNLYTIPSVVGERYWYLDNPYAEPNKRALLAFKAWCVEHRVPLVVVLIPRHEAQFKPEYKAELHSFLTSNGIRFVDLAGVFAQRHLYPGDLYWRDDPHFNPSGNAMVARALLDSFPQYLDGTGKNGHTN